MRRCTVAGSCRFLSTLSLRRATVTGSESQKLILHFYPRSPCGERLLRGCRDSVFEHFYPRSPCGERPYGALKHVHQTEISIHALLAESDIEVMEIGVRAPIFLSTLSLRRATLLPGGGIFDFVDFYPRSPCGERQLRMVRGHNTKSISIHALLAESDGAEFHNPGQILISIHALLAESDRQNPGKHYVAFRFLSTLSLRRATRIRQGDKLQDGDFYPRSPCGERREKMELNRTTSNFYPRSPCGERHPFFCAPP